MVTTNSKLNAVINAPKLPPTPVPTNPSNQRLWEINHQRRLDFIKDPRLIYPWWSRCTVRVLLVTDGGLDFGQGDFGLSTLVDILQNDAPSRVNFALSLAHLRSDVGDAAVKVGAPGIVKSIKGFRFDEHTHFSPADYDEVWLFGVETNFYFSSYSHRNSNRGQYPANSLSNNELIKIDEFMRLGGGVFATGDHGSLGAGLCGNVARVRSMRHWSSFFQPGSGEDEVSMTGPKRNDTNLVGSDTGTQFSDQSDDIPQIIQPKLYRTRLGRYTQATYPHPLLCGKNGIINVLPDHPHEGECRVPDDLLVQYIDGSNEYPEAKIGGFRVAPEIIATGHVPAGNRADKNGSKQATVAHSFPIISAYDGHLAGIGRISCDSTWHHFINVNLIGVVEGGGFDQFDMLNGDFHAGEDASKHNGFLSSASGMAALNRIKNYFTNIGVWLAPETLQTCFNRKVWWELIYSDRIMEAALTDPAVAFEKIPTNVFYSIGVHARDVFGKRVSQCQSLIFILDWLPRVFPELIPWIDPWDPLIDLTRELQPRVPLFDPSALAAITLGAAIVSLRQEFPYPPQKITEDLHRQAEKILLKGGRRGAKLALDELEQSFNIAKTWLTKGEIKPAE
ncbi:MAG TPA: hypothetical protein VIZ65_02805 [Cellvibrionaceae bacterium]